jgi:hypothetical protein
MPGWGTSMSGTEPCSRQEKWCSHPNLRLRPSRPAAARGRLQRQVRRAFIAGGPQLTSSEIYDWTNGRNRKAMTTRHRYSVWRILTTIADPGRRVPPYGARLWRLKSNP